MNSDVTSTSLRDAALEYVKPGSYQDRKRRGLCARCCRINTNGKVYCNDCSLFLNAKYRERKYDRYLDMKEKCFDHYGRVCSCCGEDEVLFLEFDHINNDGWIQRKEVGHKNIYAHILSSGFPDDIQVLCSNCNQGKRRNGGVCPHKTR